MHYIIQENVFKEQHYDMLQKTLDRFGLTYDTVRIFPFIDKIVSLKDIDHINEGSYDVDDLPDFKSTEDKVFVFGGLKLARLAADQNFTPSSLMNANHDFQVYSKYYKENLLNYDSEIHSVGSNLPWQPNEVKFIRPTKDTKSFTGKVFTETEWKNTMENYLHNFRSNQFNEQTEIQVSTPKIIHKEIRFWVVDGKIITGSQYRLGNNVIYDDIYEQEAIEFAQNMVDKFQLAKGFVIDVCLTDNGWKIVECNCINCAGFYKADLQKVIIALENYYENNN